MNCQDALRHALAGGPLPAEAQGHVHACHACTQELSDLQSIESRLVEAAEPPELPPGLEDRVLLRLRPRRRLAWTRIPAAAALLLAAALMTAWLTRVPAPHLATASLPSSDLSQGLSFLDDSTAGLLQAYEPVTEKLPDVPAEEMEGVLSPAERGGWNG